MIELFKSQPTFAEQPTPDLRITATEEIPKLSGPNWMDESRARFDEQGKLLSDALFASLPGGTIDALLIEMLKRKASHFVVRYSP